MKKSRAHRKGRASDSDSRRNPNARSSKSRPSPSPSTGAGAGAGVSRPLSRNTSSVSSEHARPSQRIDLVVEDHEAEEADREQAQRTLGSAWAGDDTRHFA